MTQEENKNNTIKWLQLHLEEILSNAFGTDVSVKDMKVNKKNYDEINEAINWIKKIKTN